MTFATATIGSTETTLLESVGAELLFARRVDYLDVLLLEEAAKAEAAHAARYGLAA
jgi:hypothetical protein